MLNGNSFHRAIVMLRLLGGALVILLSWSCGGGRRGCAWTSRSGKWRYAKKIGPCAIRITYSDSAIQWPKGLAELDHPATKKDVKLARRFSPSRVWGNRGFGNSPTSTTLCLADWPVLTTPRRVASGFVLQAEDLRSTGDGSVTSGSSATTVRPSYRRPRWKLDFSDWPWFPNGGFFAEIDWGITIPVAQTGVLETTRGPDCKRHLSIALGVIRTKRERPSPGDSGHLV